ncbi:unnamed protein product [Nippostrongylus brasiliensis]|uniref:CIA30 domain-containing protein n=1 Tax=Nippostrongylus brasiliensis TaxID=27835 RepID=A0A0N4XWQ6_NIPBR|nr:unnamed protein product [Nippostrongylus brasiliensis]
MNTNFPERHRFPGYDKSVPLAEVVKDAPRIMKKQVEVDVGCLRQDEARIEWKFDTPEVSVIIKVSFVSILNTCHYQAISLWRTGCDADWNEGFSSCRFVPTDNNTAIFSGKISTEIIKDGRIERAGWASVKSNDKKAFNRKKYVDRWRNFSHLLIKVMLHAPGAIDMTWGDSYSYPLHTRGGPYWQYEKIPFSKFFLTVQGRIQDKQNRVFLNEVSSVGIVLMDRIDGEFKLELDYIGVCNDRSHLEQFAYETYTLPLFNTHGF